MRFVVFSYNRGEFLDNCIASIEHCAPSSRITIFDDDSNDEATRRVLRSQAERHTVVSPQPGAGAGSKHGGLYANMQSALEHLDPADICCFLQDDMQLVRRINDTDVAEIIRFLDEVDNAGFVQPAFFKGCNRRADRSLTRFDPEIGGYVVDRFASSAGACYSDIFVARSGTLTAAGWRFRDREARNESQARDHFRQMMYLKNPFAAWLPYAPAYRGRTRTLALRIGHRGGHFGFHPFRLMSGREDERFRNRNSDMLPFAEDFLTLTGPALPEPWIYHPLQGRRLLKLLNSAELRLRSALR